MWKMLRKPEKEKVDRGIASEMGKHWKQKTNVVNANMNMMKEMQSEKEDIER